MKTIWVGTMAVVALAAVAHTGQAQNKGAGSDKQRLIGAWRLARIEAPGAGAQPTGMLIYTGDGHMSVQLMYPESANATSNEYVEHGYEASFGSYDVNESTHMLTHHVQGSITRGLLVGKDLRRIYQLTKDGLLIIRSARPDEHWSVTWARD